MKQIKLFSILMMLVLCCGTVFAQGITITGTITDAKTSESLPGASVVLKGTTQGTISDMDGKYSISATPGATLVILSLIHICVCLRASLTGYKLLKERLSL